jgi:hypothetical protein
MLVIAKHTFFETNQLCVVENFLENDEIVFVVAKSQKIHNYG